ncbi:TonB-dependent receptor [Segatella copri]|uniref:TonB-dependent receptor n=1 Tax=Segatella copri TaxID=165179 RepID=UPI002939746F|nr:TonB-dependent receptor [Segatella copri]MDV3107902.1 TonB-dependent receptor [Segatella copri]MDV3114913.1 TonB-dependent receptor [Segatella copri]WOF88750.1 TonB-dependent receptor [Segatella copri]WOF94894.1 TonB-dependent receptor [Segatella copri]
MQKRLHLLVALLAFMVSTAMAQITTSGVKGLIKANGEDVIGATITVTHVPTGAVYRSVTNSVGRFTIQGMRAGGPYTVEISYIGYKTKEIKNVTLKLGEMSDLSTQLEEDAHALGEVVVKGKLGLDASKTGAAASYSAKDIANMPSISHSIGDITRMNPMVSVSQSGAMSFAGVNNRYNSFQVDGAVNNDVFGLTSNGQNGGQAGAQPISTETIDQVQVSVAPFDVRQSGFTGGAINAITKSGTNTFHGSVYGNWLNKDLIGSKYTLMNGKDSQKYDDETDYRYGVTLGGPIIKNKLFFFANYEKSNKEYPNNYGYGSDASKLGTEGFKIADEVLSILKEKGYNASYNNPKNYTKSDKAGIKLDWNINDKHKATFGWRMVNAKQLNSNSTAGYLNASDYQYDFVSKSNTFTAELNSSFSEKINNQFQASYVSVRDHRDPKGIAPMIQIKNVGGGTLCLGTERSSTANSLNQDIFSFTDNLNWYVNNHTLTFGTHGEYYKFKNLFIQDNYGTYYFNNFDDFKMFASGQTYAASVDKTTGVTTYYNTLNQYRYCTANVAVTGDPRWAPEFAAGQIGFYAQDKFNVTPNFELTYGLRMDIPLFFDTPTENAEFNASAAKQGWNVVTNHKLSSTPMWSPRVGFRWNIEKEHNMILRGGAGIFTGRIPFVWLSNNFTNTGIQTSVYNVYGSTGLKEGKQNTGKLSDVSLIVDPYKQSENTDKLGTSNQAINVFDKDFKFTQNLRLDLALDFTLAGIDFTLEGVFSKNLNDIYYKDLTRTEAGKTLGETYESLSFDNRPMFAKITSTEDANLKKFTNVYMLDNTSKGYSYNLSLSAVKRFDFGLDLAASYTYSRSKSVNCGTSSVAQSNYNYNYTYQNPNSPELGFTAFNVPHQIKASAFYHKDYAEHWNTTVGLIYTGTSGSPYSLYYYGDLNQDGSNGNDLMFIPTDEQIDKMQFKANKNYTADEQKENFREWIANDGYMSKHRGEYFKRYADNLPFESHFDFHLAQTYKFKVGAQVHSVELSFDVLNVGNMFNKKWGRYTSTGTAKYYSPVTYSGNGQFQFLHPGNYEMRSYDDYYSRWRGQLGLKYTF